MSAARSPHGPLRGRSTREPTPREHGRLTERRLLAHRRRRIAQVDVCVGLAAALILILAAPGLAITALVALAVLLLCAASLAFELAGTRLRSRWRRRARR